MSPGDDAAEATPLPLLESFAWGCVGGLIAGVVLFVLPPMMAAYRSNSKITRRGSLRLVVALLGTYVLLAGAGTLLIGGISSISMAIKVGVGVQGFIKGVLASGAEITDE